MDTRMADPTGSVPLYVAIGGWNPPLVTLLEGNKRGVEK